MWQAQAYILLSPFALLLVITCIIVALVNKKKDRFNSLLAFLVENALIILFTTMELSAKNENSLLMYSRLTYTCIALLPVAWLFFCLEYTTGKRPVFWLRLHFFLYIIPALTILAAWTDPQHHLLWADSTIETRGTRLLNHVQKYGPWFWVHSVYSYILYLAGVSIIVRDFIKMDKGKRSQCVLTIVGVSLPIATTFLYVLRLIPGIQRDFSSIVFSLSGLAFLVSIIRYRLFDTGSIEYRKVIEKLPRAIIFIDKTGIIREMNEFATVNYAGDNTEWNLHIGGRFPIQEIELAKIDDDGVPVDIRDSGGQSYHIFIIGVVLNTAGERGYSVQLVDAESANPISAMSKRERDVYALLVNGNSTKQIAETLCISENTAKTHIKHIYEKLQVSSRKELLDNPGQMHGA
jgi:DNA-binding CsgD family transcriptional regulator